MKTKKFIHTLAIILLFVVAVVFGCVGLSACAKGGGDNGVNNGNVYGWKEYEGVKIAFADEDTYNDGDVNDNRILPKLDCKRGDKYYMIIDFTIRAPYDNNGRETVTAAVRVYPTFAVAATIQDTNSGNISEEKADDATVLKATYTIPEKTSLSRDMRLVIQLKALQGSEVYIDTKFENENGIEAVKTSEISQMASVEFTQGLTYDEAPAYDFENDRYYDDKYWYYVNGIDDTSAANVIIPAMKDGWLVVGILENAFSECENLKSISIPEGVKSVDSSAFEGCPIEEAVIAGSNCDIVRNENLKKIIITSGDYIGSYALSGCSSLESITIPESIMEIGEGAFDGCDKIIKTEGGVKYVGDWAIGCTDTVTEVSLKRSTTGIAESAFENSKITSIKLNDKLISISSSAFRYSTITSIDLPKSLTYIGSYVFENSYLKNITIPDSVTTIGERVFKGCGGLESATIGKGLKNLGSWAFYDCGRLKSVTLPEGLTEIDSRAFYDCRMLERITIPEGVTSIYSYAFENCNALTDVTLPDSVNYIASYAFERCGITSIVIPEGVQKIDKYAFAVCSHLQSVAIPVSVKTIDAMAFGNCKNLTDINYSGTTEQWKKIDKSYASENFIVQKYYYWNQDTGNYTVHCTDGDLTKSQAG